MSARPAYRQTAHEVERQAKVFCKEPGYYAIQLTKGGVKVGLWIKHEPTRDPLTGELLDRSWYWTVFVNGKQTTVKFNGERFGDATLEPPLADYIGWPIDEGEYRFLVDQRAWAAQFAPDRPEADPRHAVDFHTSPPLF